MQDIKVGDTVHVRGVVTDISARCVEHRPRVLIDDMHVFVNASDIVHVEPRALAVGDRVTRTGNTQVGVIRGVVDDYAVVLWGDSPVCVKLTKLVRA